MPTNRDSGNKCTVYFRKVVLELILKCKNIKGSEIIIFIFTIQPLNQYLPQDIMNLQKSSTVRQFEN